MEIKASSQSYFDIECDALAVAVYEGEKASEGWLAELDKRTGGTITSLIETGEFVGKSGESAYLHNPGDLKARRLLLLGAGKEADFDANVTRKLAGTAARSLRKNKARNVAFLLKGAAANEHAQAAAEGALWALFDPDKYHTSDKPETALESFTLVGEDAAAITAGLERGRIIAEAANFGRDVINEPSNLMTPTALAAKAEEVAKSCGLELDVLDEARMRELGMGSLLGVAQGSAEPPKLIVLRYHGADKKVKPEGYAVDKTHPDIIYVSEDVHFDLHKQTVSWPQDGRNQTIKLLHGKTYVRPSGYKVHMEPVPGTRTAWRGRDAALVIGYADRKSTARPEA